MTKPLKWPVWLFLLIQVLFGPSNGITIPFKDMSPSSPTKKFHRSSDTILAASNVTNISTISSKMNKLNLNSIRPDNSQSSKNSSAVNNSNISKPIYSANFQKRPKTMSESGRPNLPSEQLPSSPYLANNEKNILTQVLSQGPEVNPSSNQNTKLPPLKSTITNNNQPTTLKNYEVLMKSKTSTDALTIQQNENNANNNFIANDYNDNRYSRNTKVDNRKASNNKLPNNVPQSNMLADCLNKQTPYKPISNIDSTNANIISIQNNKVTQTATSFNNNPRQNTANSINTNSLSSCKFNSNSVGNCDKSQSTSGNFYGPSPPVSSTYGTKETELNLIPSIRNNARNIPKRKSQPSMTPINNLTENRPLAGTATIASTVPVERTKTFQFQNVITQPEVTTVVNSRCQSIAPSKTILLPSPASSSNNFASQSSMQSIINNSNSPKTDSQITTFSQSNIPVVNLTPENKHNSNTNTRNPILCSPLPALTVHKTITTNSAPMHPISRTDSALSNISPSNTFIIPNKENLNSPQILLPNVNNPTTTNTLPTIVNKNPVLINSVTPSVQQPNNVHRAVPTFITNNFPPDSCGTSGKSNPTSTSTLNISPPTDQNIAPINFGLLPTQQFIKPSINVCQKSSVPTSSNPSNNFITQNNPYLPSSNVKNFIPQSSPELRKLEINPAILSAQTVDTSLASGRGAIVNNARSASDFNSQSNSVSNIQNNAFSIPSCAGSVITQPVPSFSDPPSPPQISTITINIQPSVETLPSDIIIPAPGYDITQLTSLPFVPYTNVNVPALPPIIPSPVITPPVTVNRKTKSFKRLLEMIALTELLRDRDCSNLDTLGSVLTLMCI